MKPELAQKLYDGFPRLYKGRELGRNETLMRFGFPGDGWFNIIYQLSEKLERIYQETFTTDQKAEMEAPGWGGDKYIAFQVKQKCGGLRFYLDVGLVPVAMREAIEEAESLAGKTCDVCGEPGTKGKGFWSRTCCEEHTEIILPHTDNH